MKKIKEICWKNKKTKIITITGSASIAMLVAVTAIIGVILNYQNNLKTTQAQTLSQETSQTEVTGEEVSMEELEEQANEMLLEEKQVEENLDTPTKQTNKKPYYIKVNYGAQVVTIYALDENGNYTKPVKAMVCSTGVYTPTSGVYKIPARWEWLGLQGNVYGHYATQIKGNILFHSVPYLEKYNPASLEYWEYDKLGTYASAGCVRLTVADAKWIYDNCANGTYVEFYSSSNPGPLGKPTARKISNMPENLRNWDPTDSNPNNPWHSYEEKQNQENIQLNEISSEENKNQEVQVKNEIVQITNTEKYNIEVENTIQNNTIQNNTVEKEEQTNKEENSIIKNEQMDKNKEVNTIEGGKIE